MYQLYLLGGKCVANKPRLRKLLPNGPLPDETGIGERKNDNRSRYLCEECGNFFSNLHNLSEHIQLVHPERLEKAKRKKLKYFRCDLCTYCTRRAAFLQRHMLATHVPVERSWRCDQCDKTFLDKYCLTQHKKMHSVKTFHCEEEGCDSSFLYQSELVRHHKKAHTPKEQPLTCQLCGHTAADMFQFKKHTKIAHSEKKPIVCKECGSCFTFFRSLRMHLRTHKNIRPFKCPHCNYRCSALENLRRHIMTTKRHPDKKIFQCKLCSSESEQFATNNGNDFRFHLLDKHRSDESSNNIGFKTILPFVVGICEDYYDFNIKEKSQIIYNEIESESDNTSESVSQEEPVVPTPIKIQIHSDEHQRLRKIKKFMQPSLNIPAMEDESQMYESPIILSSTQVNPSCDPMYESVLYEVNSNHQLLHIPEFCEPSAMQSIDFLPSEQVGFINQQESFNQESQFPEPSVVPTVQNSEYSTSTSEIVPISSDNQFVHTHMNLLSATSVIQSNREVEIQAESQMLPAQVQTVDATTQNLPENQMFLMDPSSQLMQTVNLCYEEPSRNFTNQNNVPGNSTMDSMIFVDPSQQFLQMLPEASSQVSDTPMLNSTQNESQMPVTDQNLENSPPLVAAASTQTNDFNSEVATSVPSFNNLQMYTKNFSATQFIDNSSETQSNCLNMIYPNNATQFLQVQDMPLNTIDTNVTPNMFMLQDQVFQNLDPDFVNQSANNVQEFSNINVFAGDDFMNNSSYFDN